MTEMQRPPGRPRDEHVEQYVQQILAMKVDASVFVAEATIDQLEFLRKPVSRAGARIEIIKVDDDEIYHQSGVRLFRREGLVDEL